jgi:hypothetical protein
MSNGTYDMITLHIVPSDQARCLIFAKIFFMITEGGGLHLNLIKWLAESQKALQ